MTDTFTARPSSADIQNLFAQRSHWQSWLDVEAALAQTQAEMGMIPAAAALEIERKANLDHVDATALAADIARTRAPIVSLVRALARVCEGDAGGYVHWGATTQNVMLTARTLLMRRAHEAFMTRLGDVLFKLADLADAGAGMLTAGRTNFRQGLPITFGFKAAAWIEEFLRHQQRFEGAEPRVFASLWGGALGAMHTYGDQGGELNRRLSRRLGLTPLTVPSRAGTDYIVEHFLLLALFSASCSKIARDLYGLMADEIGEVYENQGDEVVGSSTMPNKVNPKVVVVVIALAARLRALTPLALEAMQPTHEGDAANNQMLYALIDQACPLAYELVCAMDELLACLKLAPENMRRNVASSGQTMAAENAMMILAPALGRTQAYERVKHAIAQTETRGGQLADRLLEEESVRHAVEESALRAALDPAAYTGNSAQMAKTMAASARRAATALTGG
ncbi:lyase family protein [Bordetella sp. FB-8]|uniref:lyase family protein n=1 Tax=Bordetella sp. FB-8 TaxID=1159870 RepID=UPI00037976D2|nr:lyase family protein [Bordetella sp. FB-8]